MKGRKSVIFGALRLKVCSKVMKKRKIGMINQK